MNRKALLLSAAAVLLVFGGLEYYLHAQQVENPLGTTVDPRCGKVDLLDEGADRELCQQDCRERFGAFGGYDNPRARAYARCIQDCDRQFWRDYDRRFRDLDREKK